MNIFNSSTALNIMRNINSSNSKMQVLSMQLSSGNRLVSASIDPAGFAISEKMQAQIRGLTMAQRNTSDGISMLQTAEGYLSTVSDMVVRIKELTVQAANGTNESSDINKIQNEISQLLEEITSSIGRSEYNKKSLFDSDKSLYLQTGANSGQGINVSFSEISLEKLGLDNFDLTGLSSEEISEKLTDIDKAHTIVNNERSKIGSYINRLNYTSNYLDNSIENLTAANGRISDTDMAKAMMEFTKEQIRNQFSITLLSNLFDHERTMIEKLLSSIR